MFWWYFTEGTIFRRYTTNFPYILLRIRNATVARTAPRRGAAATLLCSLDLDGAAPPLLPPLFPLQALKLGGCSGRAGPVNSERLEHGRRFEETVYCYPVPSAAVFPVNSSSRRTSQAPTLPSLPEPSHSKHLQSHRLSREGAHGRAKLGGA